MIEVLFYIAGAVTIVVLFTLWGIVSIERVRKEREILYYENYFIDFFMSLEDGAKKKISYVLDMLKTQERLNKNFVKLIRDGVYELRASHNGNIYRAFFIFDDGNIVMLFNGFQKKTQKTPDSEIEKALKLKNEYYASKP